MNSLDNLREKTLAEAGLSQSERKVYLSGVRGEELTSAELIRRTQAPRPTVMAALKVLQGYGLCQTHRRDGRSLVYVMQPASALKSHIGQQIRNLDGLMGQLDHIDLDAHTALSLQNREGQDGLEELLELALRCHERKWQIIAPRANAIAFMPKDYIDYFKRVRTERQIQSQTLWESARKNDPVPMKDVLMRKPRYVPESLGKNIPSLMLAFDDMLLVIDGTAHPSAALIQNKPVVATFQLLFEMAWRNSRK